MLRVERAALTRIREAVRSHSVRLPAQSRAATLIAVQSVARSVEAALRHEVLVARAQSRDAAHHRVGAEYALASAHIGDMPVTRPKRGNATLDTVSADVTARSFSSAWASVAIASAVRGADDPASEATKRLDYRLDTIAATEVSQAWNDEHRAEWDQVATDHRGAIWLGLLLRRWDATLDRKVCAICRAHDGEVRVIGFDFDGGDEPGFVHPRCRCQSSTYTATTVAARILAA